MSLRHPLAVVAAGKTGTAFALRNGKVWRVTIGVSGIFG
jgi:hypothetical protein